MCGITGSCNISGKSNRQLKNIVETMTSRLNHRGPDHSAVICLGRAVFGHTRLKIIDLSNKANQPMHNEKNDILLTFNGEIYNYDELKNKFLTPDRHTFRSRSDSEVLLHLYEEHGPNFIKLLNGIFSFALWDNKKKILLLARDPFGIKPLFYTIVKNNFYFASEIKSLLAVKNINVEPSKEALNLYLSLGYIPGRLSAFDNIYKLEPGHFISINTKLNKISIKKYFDLAKIPRNNNSFSEALINTKNILLNSIKAQLWSDVPVGIMLSGGLDSSTITALASTFHKKPFHTFTLKFQNKSFDESKNAKLIAIKYKTIHHEIMVTAKKVKTMIPKYLCYFDEPIGDSSAIPVYLLSKYAKKYVTVLLSGDGGDELFVGYDTYLASKLMSFYKKIPIFLRDKIISKIINFLPVTNSKLNLFFLAKRFINGSELSIPGTHLHWRHFIPENIKKKILVNYKSYNNLLSAKNIFTKEYNRLKNKEPLEKLILLDSKFHLPDKIETKTDRMTMANSIECRVPLLDLNLVRYVSSLPLKYKLKGFNKKYILRKILISFLPKELLAKRKNGLVMPYSTWLKNELYSTGKKTLLRGQKILSHIFDFKEIFKLWEEHHNNKDDHNFVLWAILNYIWWYDIYFVKKNYTNIISS